ncbi:MAG: class II aldolase/adducin family protein [Anaerolineales bacterium]|nr:class II aldolase/adducin family protein [Anaerolineales bacterium]
MRKRASDPAASKNAGVVDRLSTTYSHLWGKKPQGVAKPRAIGSDVRDLFATEAVRAGMIETAAQAAQLGLVAGQLSEASLRLAGDKFLVTVAGSWLYQLRDADLLLASDAPEKGFAEEALPAHWHLHLAGYRQAPQAGAALLGHPAAALALMAQGNLPDLGLLSGADALGTLVICAEVEQVKHALSTARVLFVKGVGILVFAETLQQAIMDLQLVNRLSEISLYQTRGNVN